MPALDFLHFELDGEAATIRLAQDLAPRLGPGDILLLEGPIGAGKTLFARALIQHRLARAGRMEEVPSPTFTLVQVYEDEETEIWHCDLYRLGQGDQAELGLEEAFETALCLVEWPDRLGADVPKHALHVALAPGGNDETRHAVFSWSDPKWAPRLANLSPGEVRDAS